MLRDWGGKKGVAAREKYLRRRAENDYKVNHVARLLHPALYDAVLQAKKTISGRGEESARWASQWHSEFPAIALMENRTTKEHRDDSGVFFCADFLYLLGSFVGGDLCLPDLNLRLEWVPGAACMFDGRTFTHSVRQWKGSRRLCFSHYLWKTSMEDLKVTLPDCAPDLAGITERVKLDQSELERECREKEEEEAGEGGSGPSPHCGSDGQGNRV